MINRKINNQDISFSISPTRTKKSNTSITITPTRRKKSKQRRNVNKACDRYFDKKSVDVMMNISEKFKNKKDEKAGKFDEYH